MQLNLFELQKSYKDNTEDLHECRTCKELLPVTSYQVRSDRSNYRAKDCLKCTAKETKIKEDIRRNAPPRPDKCDCCGKEMKYENFYLDHCHDTKVFRGWLCNTCNSGIGILGDTVESLETALMYLRKHYDN
jgi:hypothetical protein